MIGWRQALDPELEPLADLTSSASGMFYNDEHPLLSPANLQSVAPQFELYEWDAWSALATYQIGAIVESAGETYRALAVNTNSEPPSADWAVYHPLTEWLKEKTEAGIIRAVQYWLDKKFEVKTARNLLDSRQLFEIASKNSNLDEKQTQFVGFEFVPNKSKGIVLALDEIGLQFTAAQLITVYLFSSDQAAPVDTITLDYTDAGSVQWFALDWQVRGQGAHYVGYKQTDLVGQSINGVAEYNYDKVGMTFYPGGRYFECASFSALTDAAALWDISGNRYNLGTNYGLNFRLNARCDYTEFILEQKDLFKTAIAKQVAIDLLRHMALNPSVRVNRNESNFDAVRILYEIDGDSQGRPGGLRRQFEDAIKSITFDTHGIDKVCLPCRRMGVKYRAI